MGTVVLKGGWKLKRLKKIENNHNDKTWREGGAISLEI